MGCQAVTSEISNFRGEFGFLSNFAPCRLALDGKFYTSAEHAYQASKAVNETDREAIGTASSPVKAKRLGKVLIQIRPDWEEVKADVMLRILRQKFSSPTLKSRLLGTGDTELIEGNVWGD